MEGKETEETEEEVEETHICGCAKSVGMDKTSQCDGCNQERCRFVSCHMCGTAWYVPNGMSTRPKCRAASAEGGACRSLTFNTFADLARAEAAPRGAN